MTVAARLHANGNFISSKFDEYNGITSFRANTSGVHYVLFDEVTSSTVPLRQLSDRLVANGVFDEITVLNTSTSTYNQYANLQTASFLANTSISTSQGGVSLAGDYIYIAVWSNPIRRYSIPTGGTFGSVSANVTPTDLSLRFFTMSPDGLNYYYGNNVLQMYTHTQSTAYALSSAGSSTSTGLSTPTGFGQEQIMFKGDGTRCYVVGYSDNYLRHYTLSTPWDVTTMSLQQEVNYYDATYGPITSSGTMNGVWVSDDGYQIIILQRGVSTSTPNQLKSYYTSIAYNIDPFYFTHDYTWTLPSYVYYNARDFAIHPEGGYLAVYTTAGTNVFTIS